ncbi:hypothetical protein AAG593_03220 [Citromicrobium bathyomarinum]|uniref:hypothetical protein n=1 Tax=Sphingomonadales TaxID=204457 RepID=UPI0012E12F3F|nr:MULTISPECIES: hypothetical protein [Sphingomonadales]|tara:strand:- start:2652 stop:2858 length:207 start_codon:yes stop_codon:yes gene_type:complete
MKAAILPAMPLRQYSSPIWDAQAGEAALTSLGGDGVWLGAAVRIPNVSAPFRGFFTFERHDPCEIRGT